MTFITSITCCCVFCLVEGSWLQKLEGVFSCWGNVCMCCIGLPLLIILLPIWCPIFCIVQMCSKNDEQIEMDGGVDLSGITSSGETKDDNLKMIDIEVGLAQEKAE